MNKWVGIGRLTQNPEITYSQEQMMIARYTLAIDRIGRNKETDFIRCVAFDKRAQFAEKYLTKGMKIAVSGRIKTGKYEKDGVTHYTTDILIDEQEFCESKGQTQESEPTQAPPQGSAPNDGFMNMDDIDMSDLPFN